MRNKTKLKVRKIQKPIKRGKLTMKQCRDAVKSLKKLDIVQVKNPKTGLYIKIDRSVGKILAYKKTKGAYKCYKIARKIKNMDMTNA